MCEFKHKCIYKNLGNIQKNVLLEHIYSLSMKQVNTLIAVSNYFGGQYVNLISLSV